MLTFAVSGVTVELYETIDLCRTIYNGDSPSISIFVIVLTSLSDLVCRTVYLVTCINQREVIQINFESPCKMKFYRWCYYNVCGHMKNVRKPK